MKLYKKIASLLAVAALAAVLMPVCMAAPGDSIETRLNHAFALRASTEFYEEVVTTSPDGTTQTMTAARSNGNAYIKMDMGEAGQLVYILKDGQGYLVDAASKLAVKGEAPTVTVSEEAVSGEAQAIPCTVTDDERERSGLRGPVLYPHRGRRPDVHRLLLPRRR